jgi:hypothetical protein
MLKDAVLPSIATLLVCTAVLQATQAQGARKPAALRNEGATSHALFEYHSGFWVNLHHFLYEEADAEASRTKPIRFKAESGGDEAIHAELSPAEQKDWARAVDDYESQMIQHDLLFDPNMIRLKDRLEELENATTVRGSGLDPGLIDALERAAPIYRAHWWPQHDQANRAWIRAVSPLVEKNGARLSKEIAAAYDTRWPSEPVRVDVVAYANWAGAYTSLYPTHVTISSLDPSNQGTAALEVIFHESSHALIANVGDAISRECDARHVALPRRDLWHAVLFFTAGYYVRQLNANYVPYADKNGLWTRAWPMYRAPLAKDWQPHLEGRTSLQAAIASLVADVGVPERAGESAGHPERQAPTVRKRRER